MNKLTEQEKLIRRTENEVHHILAHSYSFYLILFLTSFFLDMIFQIKLFNGSYMDPIGFGLLLLASILIIWAQKTSRHLTKGGEIKTENFCKGPYCYTRTPTHWGLFFLTLGFGIIINAFFIVLATIISMLITKSVFLAKQERLLEEKYGEVYSAYKKMVKF